MDDLQQLIAHLQLPPDRMLNCQECGIRFVWTGWEQRQDAETPTQCPGCRHLLALARRWGVVKWFNARQGFGIITTTDGMDVIVRRRDIKKGPLRKGKLVSFRLKEGKKGPRAAQVRVMPLPTTTTSPAA